MTTTAVPSLVPVPPGSQTTLHAKPALAPLWALLCLMIGLVCLFTGARSFPSLQRALEDFAHQRATMLTIAMVLLALVAAFAVFDHVRRLKPPPVQVYLRWNRALLYGFGFSFALQFAWMAQRPIQMHALLFDVSAQGVAFAIAAVGALGAYAGWLHPLCDDALEDFPAYQAVVEAQKESYDLTVGITRKGDWKKSVIGTREWLILPEASLWTNILVLGGIGAGKTSALAYPLLTQALAKYPGNETLRPSIVLLDLKGDNALRLYDLCKALGREKEFWVVSPGNLLLDEQGQPIVDKRGRPLIPADRFLTWNPIGGNQPADIRASLLLDGLAATNDGPKMGGSSEYYENVESEFLQKALELLDAERGLGKTNLLDLYCFANDPVARRRVLQSDNPAIKNSPARLYFTNDFEKLPPEEQGTRISGLKAKLARLTSPTVQSTFCPADDVPNPWPGFLELVVNRPGVVVFSVPDSIYSRPLTRTLGITFMRRFHTDLLRRSTTQFASTGGNTKRLVLQVTDECWAFMSKGVPDFTAVSRQARACSLFLSQSLEQIPESYRSTIEGNFRTKVLLGVNDSLTLRKFEELFGKVKEHQTSVSTSESLNDVRHGVVTQMVAGKTQGLSQSTSVNERLVPRFSQTEIQHLPADRAILHLYDGQVQREASAFEVTPYFRLPYHLLHPLEHPTVGCAKAHRRAAHTYVADAGVTSGAVPNGYRCSACDFVLRGRELEDVREYQKTFPHLVPGLIS